MKEVKKCIDCKYKKPCIFIKWEEHAYKCKTCIWNKESKEEKRYDWPRRLLLIGWF